MTSTYNKIYDLILCFAFYMCCLSVFLSYFYQSFYSPSLISTPVPVVLYNSVAGSLLCQVMYSLLLLPLAIVQPLLSHLLGLLEHLNDFNRLLPETGLLEEQELGIEAQRGQWNFDLPAWPKDFSLHYFSYQWLKQCYTFSHSMAYYSHKTTDWFHNAKGSPLQINVKKAHALDRSSRRRSASGFGC